jgi:hypothetical protein
MVISSSVSTIYSGKNLLLFYKAETSLELQPITEPGKSYQAKGIPELGLTFDQKT